MRECTHCLADVLSDVEAVCPVCGARLEPAPLPKALDRAAPAEVLGVAGTALPEESEHFRRQFEERSIYLPEETLRRAEQILSSAETELRRVSILFADLRGFTLAGRQLPPEDLSRLASSFYKLCADCILRRSGFVVKFVGDAVLAVFGAPVAYDRDTENAIYAALDIRDQIEQTETAHEFPMKVRIGVATGAVKSGLMQTPAGKTYDVLGDTVNFASRLQSCASDNEIYVCQATFDAAKRAFEMRRIPPLELQGLPGNYAAYQILAEKSEAMALRDFSAPFCGRQEQLSEIADFLSRAAVVNGVSLLHVTGEAGIGKSRLVYEALGASGLQQSSIWWENAPSFSCILLYPVLGWLRDEFVLGSHDSAETVTRKIQEYLSTHLTEAECDPLLLEFIFGQPKAIQALHGVPPEMIQRNLFGLLREIILSKAKETSRKAPPTLVVDNAQWADPLTVRLLQTLANWPTPKGVPSSEFRVPSSESQSPNPESRIPNPESRIPNPESRVPNSLAIILIYRLGDVLPIPRAPEHSLIALRPLREIERQELLKRLTPSEEFLPEIREYIFSKAAGNPLFLQEMSQLVRDIMRSNAGLNGEALKNHIVDVIPVSLRDLIQSRVDRLDAHTRLVLQCASLLGLEFALSIIEMFDVIRENLNSHLQTLRTQRYLDEVPGGRAGRDPYYFFTHGLFRDAAYAALLEEQKRSLHLALARRMEIVFGDRMQEYYELLAFHFKRAGETSKTLYYLVKAADRQMNLGGYSNAMQNFREVVELLRGLPATESHQTLLARLLTRMAKLSRMAGEAQEAGEMLKAALECAKTLGNERLALDANLELGVMRLWQGETDEAGEFLKNLADKAARLQCLRVEIPALNALGVIRWQRGDFEAALRFFQSLAKLAEQSQMTHVQADAFNNAGLIYWKWSQRAQALKAFKRALPLRRKVCDHYGLCATLMNIGILQEQNGQIASARGSYSNALRLAEKTGHVQAQAFTEANLSNLERRAGFPLEAQKHAARANELAQIARDPVAESIAQENLGLAYLETRETNMARACFEAALAIAREKQQREAEIAIRLSLLSADWMEGKLKQESIEEINQVLSAIEGGGYAELKPRAWRIKSLVLDALDGVNRFTALKYLEMARDVARDTGDFFEQLETWRALRDYYIRHQEEAKAKECAQAAESLSKNLKNADDEVSKT
ncbi:MAG: tetratricopeptide repeat protein [Candidatus Sumerlaeota bacterium]|nr:tetratricopeptide repeat protein [Candidatus Sumerlaeota bacterium]